MIDTVPHFKFGRPGTRVWKWISDYFLGIIDQYGKFQPFSKTKAATLSRKWLAAEKSRNSLIFAPTVLDVVGQKPNLRAKNQDTKPGK